MQRIFFICLFSLCISSLVTCFIRSLALFFLVCLFTYCWVLTVFVYILDKPFMSFAKIFLQVCGFSISSTEHKFLILMKSSLSIISSLVLYLISYHHIQSHLDFLLLSSRSFILLHFTFKPMIHFGLNFVKGIRSVFRFFFLFCIQMFIFFSTICWKEQLSTIMLSFLLCQIPLDYNYVSVSWLPIPFHWSICLFFHQYHTVLITVKANVLVTQSCPTLWDPGLFCPWDFPGKNIGVGYYSLLQGILPTQGSNLGLPIADRFFTIWATREALWL